MYLIQQIPNERQNTTTATYTHFLFEQSPNISQSTATKGKILNFSKNPSNRHCFFSNLCASAKPASGSLDTARRKFQQSIGNDSGNVRAILIHTDLYNLLHHPAVPKKFCT